MTARQRIRSNNGRRNDDRRSKYLDPVFLFILWQLKLFHEESKRIPEEDIAKLSGQVSGKIRFMERLSMHTSFRIGGPADIWIEPADVNELRKILAFAKDRRMKVSVIGRGTNILARDEGFRGIVIHLGSPEFKRLTVKGARLKVGAGFSLPQLVSLCCDRGLAGLESLVGIPGTVGGAIFMNAGGASNPIFRNFGDFITSVKAMDYSGRILRLAKSDLEFGYRKSNLARWIIVEVELLLRMESGASLSSRASKFLKMKKAKQVLDSLSAGCVFKNPKDSQFTSGQMIDSLGLKGKSIGGAEVSKRHANFIVNRKGATCADVMGLIRLIRKRVEDNYKVKLELEVSVI
jgi:UDP-N-acetylmuramate dehydrogenase